MLSRASDRCVAAALAVTLAWITAPGAAHAEGAVIKGGTLIITPGAAVEGNIAHIRTIASPAGLAIDCPGGTAYTLSTGTKQGACSAKTDDAGAVKSARCEDGGNIAAVSCSENGGKGACGETAGSGSCTPQ